jgi:hypothetical protein
MTKSINDARFYQKQRSGCVWINILEQ